MEWCASIDGIPRAQVAAAISDALPQPVKLNEAGRRQFDMAKDVARRLAPGVKGAVVFVSLVGHVREINDPTEGWAGDAITVNVSGSD